MPDFANMTLAQLVRPEGYACSCGRHHVCALKYLNIGRGIITEVPEMVAAMGRKKPFVVCDGNTWAVAGKRVDEILTAAGIDHMVYVVPLEKPDNVRIAPAEWETGSIIMHFDPTCDMFLAVGSGVINDLCKVAAYATGRPTAVVGTAPSMDGYASNSSSMEMNHVKVSLYNHGPEGILLDSEILAQAPMRMLWAGLGDMVAKYVALCEWRISHIVTGEYYCEDVAGLMRAALRKLMAVSDRITSRDPDAIAAIAEGLVLAGIGMAYAQISRPELLSDGTRPDRQRAEAHMRAFDRAEWEAQVRRIFGKTADEIIAIEDKTRKNDPTRHARRLDNIIAHWDDILAIIREELPDYDWLYGVMAATGMPLTPADIDIPTGDVVNAFIGARDIRDKYLSCSLLWDMGLTEEYAAFLERES